MLEKVCAVARKHPVYAGICAALLGYPLYVGVMTQWVIPHLPRYSSSGGLERSLTPTSDSRSPEANNKYNNHIELDSRTEKATFAPKDDMIKTGTNGDFLEMGEEEQKMQSLPAGSR